MDICISYKFRLCFKSLCSSATFPRSPHLALLSTNLSLEFGTCSINLLATSRTLQKGQSHTEIILNSIQRIRQYLHGVKNPHAPLVR